MTFYDERIEKIKKQIPETSALLVTDDVSRKYLFGFSSTAGYGYISQNSCKLFLDFRYFEKAKKAVENGEISENTQIIKAEKPKTEILNELLSAEKIQNLMFEDKRTYYNEYQNLKKSIPKAVKLVPCGNVIENLRAIKDEYEIAMITQAQKITDLAFSHILEFITKGMSEKCVSAELECFMKKNGADDIAFSTICVSGKKTSMPHGEPDDTIIGNGFLTLDFGAKYCNYCSDMTRTICIGNPTDEMREIYDIVLKAQESALSMIKSDVLGKDVDNAARKVISDNGYGECFGHSTGHSLGLEIHENPNFSPKEQGKIPENAVLSVEPGIYIPEKYGVRIEDIVFLTKNGYKNLTNSTKEFIIV